MAQTIASPPSTLSSPTFVKRVAAIPVVSDTITAVHSTLQSNSYSAAALSKAEGAAIYLYEQTKPLQEKLQYPIGQVDAVANKGLDFVQAKAPYVFEARTDEIVAKARQPADQAYAYGKTYTDAASARLAPITEQFHTQLTRSSATLHALQEKLAQAVAGLPRDPKGVQDQLKTYTDQVMGEMEKLSSYVGEKRKDLPQQAQQAVSPLLEKLQQSYNDVRTELSKTETPIATRASNVLHYSREQASPLVHEALEAIRKVLGKAEKKADEATAQVNGAVNGN